MTRHVSLVGLLLLVGAGLALAQPMSGTYTIKPSGGDFASHVEAASALSSRGVSGSCTLEMYTGTYSGQAYVNNIGTTNPHEIVFRAATNETPVVTNSSSYPWYIVSTKNVTVDGIETQSPSSYGFYTQYAYNLKVLNCKITTSSYGLYLRYSDTTTVAGCDVKSGSYGIYLYYTLYNNSIVGNKINSGSSHGIYKPSTGSYMYNTVIANNMITTTANPIYLYYHYYSEIYYNTLVSQAANYALYDYYGYGGTYRNNIYYVSGNTYMWYKYYGDNLTGMSDYNCFYSSTGYANVVYNNSYGGGNLTWWQGYGFDPNSINADPQLATQADLHLKTGSPCIGAGTPVTGITKDIDGDDRDGSAPDIGADEWTYPGDPMSGLYTIKKSGGDFASFGEAHAALALRGVSGNVTFDVYEGTYTENLVLANMPNGAYSVTFQAHEATDAIDAVTLNAGGASYAVQLTDVNRFRFRNIEVTGFTSYGFYLTYASTGSDANLIEGCRIIGPNGIGLYYYCDDDSIIGNDIRVTATYGIYVYAATASRQYRTVIANNFVSGTPTYGMQLYYHEDTKLYYNSVTTTGTYCMYDYYGFNAKYNNNIFARGNDQYIYRLYNYTNPDFDYNCYYSTHASPFQIGSTTARDWTYWQTTMGYDPNGINADPLFANPVQNNLHLRTGSPCVGAGTPVTGFAKDIDGDDRDGSTPDIGADEWTSPGDPMSGLYTIKKTGGDFAGFNEAIEAMFLRGVSGNVTFDVYEGTYTENLTLQNVPNGAYSITFQAHEATDGFDAVTLNANGATNAVHLTDVNRFRFRNIEVTGFSSYGFYLTYVSTGSDANLIEGCRITGPNGISLLNYCDDDSIIGNDIRVTTSYGIYVYGASASRLYRTVIANNMVSGTPSYALYTYYHEYSEIYYNTFYTTSSYGYWDYYTFNETQKNNIFVGASYAYYVRYGNLVPAASDYNCFWLTGGGANVIYDNGTASTLATWQSTRSLDLNSINANPLFGSVSNLHLRSTSPCIGAGTPIAGITKDIDGDDRKNPPDIGADEFVARPMNGVYTIKQDGTGDFVSFNDAVAGMNIYGMSGNVTFDVYEGTYAENLVLQYMPNGAYSVTFQAHEATDGFDAVTLNAGGASYAVQMSDVMKFRFRNLNVTNFGSYGFYLGYSSTGTDTCLIEGCTITGPNGIYLAVAADYDSIVGNDIRATSSYGIFLQNSTPYNYNTHIANNFITGWTSYGIYAYYHYYTELLYNTIYSTTASRALHDYYGYNGNYQNNIFYSTSYVWYKSSGTIPDVSNYNCFKVHNQTPPYSSLIYYSGAYSLANWRSTHSRDQQSIEADPLIVGGGDLHLQQTSPCIDAGTPVAGITTDIDGHIRNGTTPCIGADEISRDIEVASVLVPTGTIKLQTPVTPQVRVKHVDGPAVTVDLVLSVQKDAVEVYSDTKTGVALAPAEEKDVTFDNAWTPTAPGADYTVYCWHSLTPDAAPENDTAQVALTVSTIDIAITEILQPTAEVDEDTDVYPSLKLRNNGAFDENVTVLFLIDNNPPAPESDGNAGIVRQASAGFETGSIAPVVVGSENDAIVYSQTQAILVPAGEEVTLTFDEKWTAGPIADFYAKTYHWVANDQNRTNDTLDLYFSVVSGVYHDVTPTAIAAPSGTAWIDEPLAPRVTVANLGEATETFMVEVTIEGPADAFWQEEEEVVALGSGQSRTITFTTSWTPTELGNYEVTATTKLANDKNTANDVKGPIGFIVAERPPWPEGWHEAKSLPNTPTAKPVKDGGWLAVGPDKTDEGEVIYAGKGNKATDFFKYYPEDDSWVTLSAIPEYEDGKRKLPNKGTRGISDGEGAVYMTRGNNMLGFWKYDIAEDSWKRANEDVPLGNYKKKVKGGEDLVYAVENETGYVYLLKGQRTEFYRYNTGSGKWETLKEVPFGGGRQKYNKGSFLAYDDATGHIYAHQAAYNDGQHHYMFRYDPAGDSWETRKGMPVYGLEGGKTRKKKSKDGAAAAFLGGQMYALKGGNTQGFFKYYPDGDSWTQEPDTMPVFGTALKKKRVKNGADLVTLSNAFFAFKGNKTYEFWRYVQPTTPTMATRPGRDGVMAGVIGNGEWRMGIGPNPLSSGFATLRYSLPRPGPVSVTVFDVAGRSVFSTRSPGHLTTGSLPLDLRKLSAGVYLVRLDADNFTQTQKLVVQK